MKAVAALFDMLPGWVWAIIVAALLATNCTSLGRMQLAKVAEAQAKETLAGERLRHEKALGAETAAVLQLERELGTQRAALEKRDAEHKTVVDGLREDLRRKSRAGGGGGLRDPNAAGGCPAPGPAAAGAGGGAGDTGQAGGLLSEPLERLLLDLTDEADTINRAYAACRDDAMTVRLKLNAQLSPPLPSAGPASPAAP